MYGYDNDNININVDLIEYDFSEQNHRHKENYYQEDYSASKSQNSIIGFVRNLFSDTFSNFSFSNIFSSLTSKKGFSNSIFGGLGLQASFGFQTQFAGYGFGRNFGFGSQNQSQFSYAASESQSTLTLEGYDNKEVWLSSESEEVMINATSTSGYNILAGNDKDNQIFGGYGHNEMWGGYSKTNDYLFGGEGENTFWYGKGEGVDLVENTKTGDTINLYNITLGDISDVEITDSSIALVIGEGEGIGITNDDAISPNFKLADGESYNYNRTSGEWQKA